MQKSKLLVAVLGALVAMPALAEDSPFSANVTLTTDYLYRGISQTGHKPAIQGGFDFAHSSGFYAGVWGSNISWLSDAGVANNASLELDTYLGFRNSFAEDFSYDVGYLRYNYPGTYAAGATKADTDEIYGSLGYKWVTLKYSYSLGKTFGVPGARGTDYIDLSANYTFDGPGVTVGAHYGKQKYKGPNAGVGIGSLTYSDYNVSVSKDFSGYVLKLAYSSTNATKGPGAAYNVLGKDLGKGTAVLSLSRSF
jgi:uncharacterized protein (TIGR02001 family)